MGVVSNKPEEMVKAVLRELGLEQYFAFTWGRDTLPVFKPDPQVIRYAIHELGVEEASRVCMVGDNPVDIQAAKGAGAISVAVSYGFTSSKLMDQEAPHHLCTDFKSVADLLRKP